MTENFRPQANDAGFATVPRHILSQELHDELILLDVNQGQYFSLNDVGSRMWVLIQEKTDLEEVINALLQE